MSGFGEGWGGGGGGVVEPTDLVEIVSFSEAVVVISPLLAKTAVPLNDHLIEIRFSHDLDFGFTPLLEVSNYFILPTLPVLSVEQGVDSNTVILRTERHEAIVYTITVGDALSAIGDSLDPDNRVVLFNGTPADFFATAQAVRKVAVNFSVPLAVDLLAIAPSSYTITRLSGATVPVIAATRTGAEPARHITLDLGSDLTPGSYVLEIHPNIKTSAGIGYYPRASAFVRDTPRSTITGSISNHFSGEVSGGILGTPAGQVFFSPALELGVADSSIQIDEIALCTRAYDVYTVPDIPDPQVLMTFGGGTSTTLNDIENVLFATAERLGLFRYDLTDSQAETMPTAVDGPADATLVETIEITVGGFLNDEGWGMFPGSPSGGQSMNSVVFDGVDEYVDMGDVVALSFTNATPFSLVCWFKSIDTDGALMSKQVAATDVGYSVSLTTGGKLRVELVNTSASNELIIETIGSFNDNRWKHVVVTYDGGDAASGVNIYVNDVVQTSTIIEDTLSATIDNAVAFQLGTIEDTDSFLAGTLDDPAVYDVELSSANVTTIYNGGIPPDLTSVGPTGDLVGYWLMGDGDTYATLTDNSSNTNDGTMTNMEAADIVVDSPPASVFTTAANLAAINPGPTVMINLQP